MALTPKRPRRSRPGHRRSCAHGPRCRRHRGRLGSSSARTASAATLSIRPRPASDGASRASLSVPWQAPVRSTRSRSRHHCSPCPVPDATFTNRVVISRFRNKARHGAILQLVAIEGIGLAGSTAGPHHHPAQDRLAVEHDHARRAAILVAGIACFRIEEGPESVRAHRSRPAPAPIAGRTMPCRPRLSSSSAFAAQLARDGEGESDREGRLHVTSPGNSPSCRSRDAREYGSGTSSRLRAPTKAISIRSLGVTRTVSA